MTHQRTKVECFTSNNIQLTPNYFAFGAQFWIFSTEQVTLKSIHGHHHLLCISELYQKSQAKFLFALFFLTNQLERKWKLFILNIRYINHLLQVLHVSKQKRYLISWVNVVYGQICEDKNVSRFIWFSPDEYFAYMMYTYVGPSPASNLYGSHMGPIMAPIGDLYGQCNRVPYGSHMGWPM